MTTIPVGDSVDFVCTTSGCGTNYTISWLKVSSRFSVHGHSLHISSAQLSDSRAYHCIVVRGDLQHSASGILMVTGMLIMHIFTFC